MTGRCHAGSDGDCVHAHCPQLRDGEPAATGRHCPLDVDRDDDSADECERCRGDGFMKPEDAKRSRLFVAGCVERGLCPMCIASGARGECALDMLGSCSVCGWPECKPLNMEHGAYISACGRYRYSLWRQWAPGAQVMFVGLNPSTADATVDDPTIRRCIGFARAWGYGGLMMTNLFAWRATDPRHMLAADDPVGPDNDRVLRTAHAKAKMTVAAWGAHGTHEGRHNAVRDLIPNLHYLRLTKDGHPGHPLYLPKTLKPVAWINS